MNTSGRMESSRFLRVSKSVLETLTRGGVGLMIGYLIGLNVAGAIGDLYFTSIGSQRRNIPMMVAVFGALVATCVVWPYWRRKGQPPTIGIQRAPYHGLSWGEKPLKDKIATLTRGAIVASGVAGVGLVLGYLIGLGVREFVIEVVENYLWPYKSRIPAVFAIGGAGLLVWWGWRK